MAFVKHAGLARAQNRRRIVPASDRRSLRVLDIDKKSLFARRPVLDAARLNAPPRDSVAARDELTNSRHYAWQWVRSDEIRRLLLLQNAAFMALYRGDRPASGLQIDSLEPVSTTTSGFGAIEETFAEIGHDPLAAARKILFYLQQIRNRWPTLRGG